MNGELATFLFQKLLQQHTKEQETKMFNYWQNGSPEGKEFDEWEKWYEGRLGANVDADSPKP